MLNQDHYFFLDQLIKQKTKLYKPLTEIIENTGLKQRQTAGI